MDEIRNIPPHMTRNTATMSTKTDAVSPEDAEKDRKLRKACADFEALFISYIFQTMRKTVPESTVTGKMPGKDTYTMIMDQKLSEDLARRGGGIGLQKVLYDQMKRSNGIVSQQEEGGAESDPAIKKSLKTD